MKYGTGQYTPAHRSGTTRYGAPGCIALLLLLFLLPGCSRAEGRAVSDFIQYLLRQDMWLRWIVCLLLTYLLLQCLRLLRLSIRFFIQFLKKSHRFIFIWGKRNLILIGVLGTLLWLCSNPLIELIQEVEQRYFSPVYVNEFGAMSEAHLTAIYEEELSRRVDPYQRNVVMQRTREIAGKIQSTPLAIYEAAYLECGLNPFEIRSDNVAAGWIQFTRIGLGGLRYKGRAVTYDDVLQACRSRDVDFVMDLTELYLVDKHESAGRKPLNNTIDLYLALFAPALIGAPYTQTVYSGFNNPSYFKNDGLDGWYTSDLPDGRKQIFRKRSQCDGKITILEIFLALEAKKARLLRQYLAGS